MKMPSCLAAVRVTLVLLATLGIGGAACFGDPSLSEDAGTELEREPVGVDCGEPGSGGNGIGIGKFCQATSECPIADDGTTIQCSTVLTSDRLPLLCSRICGELDGGSIDCGERAVCQNIIQLGYDLLVCVPNACESLFDGGLPDGG